MFPWQQNGSQAGSNNAAPVMPVFQAPAAPAAPPPARSVYADIDKEEVGGDFGRTLVAGEYMLRIVAVKEQVSKKKANAIYFIVEFELLSSNAPGYRGAMDPGNTTGKGELVSWVVDMGQMSSKRNVKQFFLEVKRSIAAVAPADWLTALQTAGFDVHYPNVGETEVLFAKGPAQPLAGIPIMCSCKVEPTRSGGQFTKHYYAAVDGGLNRLPPSAQ